MRCPPNGATVAVVIWRRASWLDARRGRPHGSESMPPGSRPTWPRAPTPERTRERRNEGRPGDTPDGRAGRGHRHASRPSRGAKHGAGGRGRRPPPRGSAHRGRGGPREGRAHRSNWRPAAQPLERAASVGRIASRRPTSSTPGRPKPRRHVWASSSRSAWPPCERPATAPPTRSGPTCERHWPRTVPPTGRPASTNVTSAADSGWRCRQRGRYRDLLCLGWSQHTRAPRR